MFLRGRANETFYIGRAVHPRREAARAELTRIREAEGGLNRLKTALAEALPTGKTDTMSDEEIIDVLADGVAAGRYVLIGFRRPEEDSHPRQGENA
jgi:hypothetical protein